MPPRPSVNDDDDLTILETGFELIAEPPPKPQSAGDSRKRALLVFCGIFGILLLVVLHTGNRAEATLETAAAKRQPVYVVKRGDNLGSIAQRTLGDRNAWHRIYAANTDILDDPSQIEVGMVLELPISECEKVR